MYFALNKIAACKTDPSPAYCSVFPRDFTMSPTLIDPENSLSIAASALGNLIYGSENSSLVGIIEDSRSVLLHTFRDLINSYKV